MSDDISEFFGSVGSQKRGGKAAPSRNAHRDHDYMDNPGSIVSADAVDGESRWSEADGLFWRAKRTHAIIPPGLYNCCMVDGIGAALRRQDLKTDDLLVLPEKNSEEIFTEFERFWTLESQFKHFGYLYKRGFLLWGPPGCHAKGTMVIMYDGSVKAVEDVVVGDRLMGPDSNPRTVLELCRGRDKMYKVIPTKGKPFVVNQHHILPLKLSGERDFSTDNRDYEISVMNFVKQSAWRQERSKLRRSPAIEWHNDSDLLIPPYILGLWLGDGHSHTASLTTADDEIRESWCSWLRGVGCEISEYKSPESNKSTTYAGVLAEGTSRSGENWQKIVNPANLLLNEFKLLDNKHIPMCYTRASLSHRLDLLAGLLDSDGSSDRNCFDFISKFEALANEVVFLCRSLGLAAYMVPTVKGCRYDGQYKTGVYYRVSISGNTDIIPCRLQRRLCESRAMNKDVLVTGFSLAEMPEDDYYGFVLDADHLYLMDDFTINHNSGKTSLINLMMQTIIRRYRGIIVIVEDPDWASQCLTMVRKNEPERPLITIMEDLDALVERWGEAGYLNLLDGSEQINNVIHIGTCFTPEVRFLTADLRWVPCGNLRVGDELWAFDEDRPTGKGNRRRFRKSVVTRSHRAVKECVRVTLDTGESLVCTTDHPWLAYRNRNENPNLLRHGWHLDWVSATNILDCGLVRPFMPWETDSSWEAGWLAGILDGEGSLACHRTVHGGPSNVSVAQNVGPIAERIAIAVLDRVDAHVYPRERRGKEMKVVDTRGGLASALSLIGQVRAERLVARADLSGGMMHNKFPAHVVSVEPVGLQEIQSIETSTHTYIAEGFACHNTNYPERLDKRFVDRPSRFDTVKKIGMPGWDARETYFRAKFDGKDVDWWNADQLDRWTKLSKGFSVAHMREMIISVCCLGQELEDVVARLEKMHERKPTSESDPDGPRIGIAGTLQ